MDESSDDQGELELVRAALASSLSTCVLWAPDVKKRLSEDPQLCGLTTKGVRDELRSHARSGGLIEQKRETWEPYRDKFKFCYVILLDLDFLDRPLFVEIRYCGTDPADPVDLIVSVHLSFKSRT